VGQAILPAAGFQPAPCGAGGSSCHLNFSRGLSLRQLAEYAAARAIIACLRVLPLPIAWPLARACVTLLDKAIPRLRRIAYRNLRFALPQADAKAITDGVFASIARLILVFARFPLIDRGNVSEWIHYEGLEHYLEAKRHGKGVLFATAHLGNWELSAFAHALMAEPMHVVVRPLDNPRIDDLVEDRRRLSGNSVIQKKEAARAILKALSRNEAVGILIDQNASPEEGVFIDFFGVPACAGLAFTRFANRTGAAVIPGFALWSEKERRYVLKFYPAIEMTGDDHADTARIHTQLEGVIREHPDQWLWIHRRWKTRPPGEPPMY
jgi:KDO2-lipid IV(A) lauroyltransferase